MNNFLFLYSLPPYQLSYQRTDYLQFKQMYKIKYRAEEIEWLIERHVLPQA